MENNRGLPTLTNPAGTPDFAVLVITATENTTGVIEFLGQTETFSLNSGEQHTFRRNSILDVDLLHKKIRGD